MARTITIKRGLRLRLSGAAPQDPLAALEVKGSYALVPDDFHGVLPKPEVHAGDSVLAGSPLFYSKEHPQMKFVSPVSGTVKAINRGAKRKILSIEVEPEGNPLAPQFKEFPKGSALTGAALKAHLLEGGMWGFFKQRPYDRVANPDVAPRDIFVTCAFTAPLAPAWEALVKGNEEYVATALKALASLTAGKLYVGTQNAALIPAVPEVSNLEVVNVKGPHPAGNVGVLINHIAPVNKGEVVWTLKGTDLLVIGKFLATGKADFSRTIAVTGSDAAKLGYLTLMPGCTGIESLAAKKQKGSTRTIAGDPFTGIQLSSDRPFTPFNIDQITFLPEGDEINEVLGWAMPRFNQYSMSRSYFSWLCPKKEYTLDTRIKGEERAMIMSNELSRVFPMDIYPEYLLKAIIAFDIDKMEQLGIYEVAPEDFAVCEFVDTSKLEVQYIVLKGLDLLYKEMN